MRVITCQSVPPVGVERLQERRALAAHGVVHRDGVALGGDGLGSGSRPPLICTSPRFVGRKQTPRADVAVPFKRQQLLRAERCGGPTRKVAASAAPRRPRRRSSPRCSRRSGPRRRRGRPGWRRRAPRGRRGRRGRRLVVDWQHASAPWHPIVDRALNVWRAAAVSLRCHACGPRHDAMYAVPAPLAPRGSNLSNSCRLDHYALSSRSAAISMRVATKAINARPEPRLRRESRRRARRNSPAACRPDCLPQGLPQAARRGRPSVLLKHSPATFERS